MEHKFFKNTFKQLNEKIVIQNDNSIEWLSEDEDDEDSYINVINYYIKYREI